MTDITTNFEDYLKKLDRPLHVNDKLLVKLPQKEFLGLIEKTLQEDIPNRVFHYLMMLLMNTHSKISDTTLEFLFDDALTAAPEEHKLYRIRPLCLYLIAFRKKSFCKVLKGLLEEYGTKEHLLESTSSFLVEPLLAVGALNCTGCYDQVKKIVSLGEKMNPLVFWAAEEVLKKVSQD